MTHEAWVRPTALAGYNTVMLKERTGYYAVRPVCEHATPVVRQANVFTTAQTTSCRGTTQLPLNTWTHLAPTYDGSVIALYVNGVQAGTLTASGAIVASTGPLKLGGNGIWGEWFNGLIDEVRICNRALTGAEIQADMNTSITAPDTTPPTAPGR